MAQLENIEAIERRLRKAADTLRSNSEPASNEYFLPVMGLIFLRLAYSRFLAVKDQIVGGLPSRGGQTRELRVENWREKESTHDAVKQKIYDFLWDYRTGLLLTSTVRLKLESWLRMFPARLKGLPDRAVADIRVLMIFKEWMLLGYESH